MSVAAAPAPRSSSRPRLWALLLPNLLWILVGLLFAHQLTALGVVTWENALWLAALDWGPWFVLSPAVLALSLRFPYGSRSCWRVTLVHLGACGSILLLMLGLGLLIPGPVPENWPPTAHARELSALSGRPSAAGDLAAADPRPRLELMRGRLVIPVYVGLVLGAHVFIYQRASRERERRALLAEAGLAEARLLALQTQLQPHFLFNALNAVTGLISAHPRQAEAMLCALAELLRGVLEVSDRREVSLAEELGLADRYLAIQSMRFSDRLRVERDIAPDTLGARVPPLLLQPLVENAILHGLAPRAAPGLVRISARREGARLRLAVRDDGLGLRPDHARPGTGVGLRNIRARLDSLHGPEASLALTPCGGGGVEAVIKLPFREAAA